MDVLCGPSMMEQPEIESVVLPALNYLQFGIFARNPPPWVWLLLIDQPQGIDLIFKKQKSKDNQLSQFG